MKFRFLVLVFSVLTIKLFTFSKEADTAKPRILIFSKTAGFRHASIEAGKKALLKLASEHAVTADVTEDASWFAEDSLKHYAAVIFLSTTGNVLNARQQIEFERYIQAGGGFVGVHAATDTEYDWPWYGKLAGAYFSNHPKIQEAVLNITSISNAATSHLPKQWKRTDEWYNFKNINPDLKVLITLDEKSYEGGRNGDHHPMAWYHDFDGGRAFYTGLGHTDESYADPLFTEHLWAGINYAIGKNVKLDYAKAKTQKAPDESRFVKTTLTQGTLYEPTEMAVLPNLDILVAQRRGEIMLYKNQTKKLEQAGFLNVYFKTNVNGINAEEGVLGIAADPAFTRNNYIYIFYSPADTSVNRLSRFKFVNNKIDNSSEKIILQFYSQRQICCHTGGSVAFGADGLLFFSTGDNSTPFDVPRQQFVNRGYAPLDNRPGLEQYDAARSAGNTNDLRGKIIRIRVKDDGTYEIPEGNLFGPNTPKARPEIYVMGNRNPYRIAIDKKTGYLYWGEIGPDANNDNPQRGPRGYDEINQARKAGNFGWPYLIGNNFAYNAYDYKTGTSGPAPSAANVNNTSPNNTGLSTLPPVQPAFIWYPYSVSKEFPEIGEGGRSAMAGPVYYTDQYPKATRYPDYYNGKLFIYEWVRNWIRVVSMKPNGDYEGMEPFLPNASLSAPVDMEAGPDGKLYILQYGSGWFTKNPEAGIVRIDYLAGNRPPQISKLNITKTSGLLPYKLTARVDAADPDNDKLVYTWNLGKGIIKTTTGPSVQYTYTKPGQYPVSVQVTDANKASSKSNSITVYAGNEQPRVNIAIKGNRTFYFPGRAVNYQVNVTDKGSTVNKSNIYVSTSYTAGKDLAAAQLGHQEITETIEGRSLMLKSDCKSCHQISTKSIGPSFTQVSARYQNNNQAVSYLAGKISKGGAGVWGEVPMPAHSSMKQAEINKIVAWILTLNTSAAKPSLPVAGKIMPAVTTTENSTLNLNAVYTDRGAAGVKVLSASDVVSLRSNLVGAEEIKDIRNISLRDSSGSKYLVMPANSGWIKINNIDIASIGNIELTGLERAFTAYKLEVRLDSETGTIIGNAELSQQSVNQQTVKIPVQPVTDGALHNVFVVITANQANSRARPLVKGLRFNPM